jgi:hypothetical protein
MTKPQTTDGEQLSENHPYNQIWDAVKYRHTYTRTMFQHDIDQLMVQRDQQRLAAVLEVVHRVKPATRDESAIDRYEQRLEHNITATLAPDTTNGVEESK